MQRRGAKSFVDDLVLSRGVVLSRAATTLRSIETKPFDWKICPLWTDNIFLFFVEGLGTPSWGGRREEPPTCQATYRLPVLTGAPVVKPGMLGGFFAA